MATLDDERGPWLVTPDGLRSPEQIRDEANLGPRCCGESLTRCATGVGCECSREPKTGWVCKKCWKGYCERCIT